jgi:azurin
MKNLLALLLVSAFAMVPAVAEEKKPETKKICVDLQGKDGKPVIDPKTKKPKQDCKEVKIHKKHEGTKPEDVKKK